MAIIGAAGQTGLSVLAASARRGARPLALLHRPAQAEVVQAAGAADVRVADLDDPPGLAAALAGVDALYVIPPVFHPREDALVAGAVAAAERAGVERVVMHSVLHPWTPGLPHHQRKANGEAALRASRLRWSILQPAMYAQTVLFYVRPDRDDVGVPYSLQAPFTVIDLADVGEAATRLLLDDGHDHATYELAGPQRLTMGTMVEQVAAVTARPLRAREIPAWDARAPATWSRAAWADLCAMWAHYDQHGLVGSSVGARTLLGREPTRFADAIAG